jgi:hypothetical protein
MSNDNLQARALRSLVIVAFATGVAAAGAQTIDISKHPIARDARYCEIAGHNDLFNSNFVNVSLKWLDRLPTAAQNAERQGNANSSGH